MAAASEVASWAAAGDGVAGSAPEEGDGRGGDGPSPAQPRSRRAVRS